MKNVERFSKVKFYFWDDIKEIELIESMWATQIGGNYKIDNIPFYVQEFALGDIISVKTIDGELFADKLIEESGNSTIQIAFLDKISITNTREELKTMGCSSERSDKPLWITVNVPKEVDYINIIKPYLEQGVQQDLWDYQEACLSVQHSE